MGKEHAMGDYYRFPSSEAFRSLRTNIQFADMDKSIKSIVITSSLPGEGKSTIALNLAATIAQGEKKVLLIDCDLRKPSIHTYSNLNYEYGLTNIIVQDMDYKYALNIIENNMNLNIITSGPIPPNPSDILGTVRMRKLLEVLRNDYDMIILDSPPVGLVTDAAVLSTLTDGVIVVCLKGKTKIDVIKKSVDALRKVNANILGIVMNMVELNESIYSKSYYNKNDEYIYKGVTGKKRR